MCTSPFLVHLVADVYGFASVVFFSEKITVKLVSVKKKRTAAIAFSKKYIEKPLEVGQF